MARKRYGGPPAAPTSMTVHGPWQITATGLPESKKLFANATALGCMRRRSGFITPPGSRRASNSCGSASSRATSMGNSSPHSVKYQPRTWWCSAGETMLVFAPTSSSAPRGLVISTCSKPSSIRIATLKPFRSATQHLIYYCVLPVRGWLFQVYDDSSIELRVVLLHVRGTVLFFELVHHGSDDIRIPHRLSGELSFLSSHGNRDSRVLENVLKPFRVRSCDRQ